METRELLSHLLTSVGVHLPVLIALGIALVMALDTPKGRIRSVALWGLAVLMLAQLGGGMASVLPFLLLAQGDFSALGSLQPLLTALHVGLALLQAGGFILLAWALVHALRGQRPAPGR
jgi:hypothetical protein